MTGWNMPPGCNVSDIPGNRPEDLAYEAFCEKISDWMDQRVELKRLKQEKIESLHEGLCDFFGKLIEEARTEGFREGVATEKIAQELGEAE